MQLKTYFPSSLTVRIDDVSINTERSKLLATVSGLRKTYKDLRILLAVSPCVFDMSAEKEAEAVRERVFPSILNAFSDHREFYKVQKMGFPSFLLDFQKEFSCELATHGLIHVDHRLLSYEAQELSILASASLVGTKIFVPPFNKYNSDTLKICADNDIALVRWEDGWTHLGYNSVNLIGEKIYFHMHDFELNDLLKKLNL